MNELLKKTEEEIEMTLLDSLYEYLKERNYFERKDLTEDAKNYLQNWYKKRSQDFDDEMFGFFINHYNENDILDAIKPDVIQEYVVSVLNHYYFQDYDNLLEYASEDFWRLAEDEDLARELEKRGWRTLNKKENLELTDFFEEDEIIDWVKDNCDLYDLVTFDWL